MAFPAPPVYDTGKVVDRAVDQINKIIETFSPLNVQERKARIAHATLLLKANQLAQAGHPELLAILRDPQYLKKQESLNQHIEGQRLSNVYKANQIKRQSDAAAGIDEERMKYIRALNGGTE